ncbi:hypothetical protein [Candidatus Stoquefichus massiliensis]|uniref:hypothetical protein n=1 Tax=Candidatus Stoquefichus massiliensis TaxID=1470350 RepID=UPI00047F4FC2|nr:hypothetical protein [Candidatus Stoquefichus massiliensis]
MKKVIFIMISLFMLLPGNTYADMGPKPSVHISLEGIHETAYMTLLSKEKSTGPFCAYENEDTKCYFEEYGPQEIWQAFVDYKDKDGFYFLQYFQLCEDSFQWTYHPPDEFKVLVYFPESDTYIVSPNSYERYAFKSYYTVSIINHSQNINVTTNQVTQTDMTVDKNYIWNEAMLGLAIRMLLTIIIEVIVALMMKINKRRELFIIVGANILTQIILNILLEIFGIYALGYYGAFFYILFETLIIIIEMNIYKKTFHLDQEISIKAYVIVVNILSFIIGFIV